MVLLEQGLLEEARMVYQNRQTYRTAAQAIGYKEIVCALRGDISMACAVDWIKQGSRRYAKRQWTWFRHDSRTKWFDCSLFESPHALHEALLMQMQEDMATYRNGEGGAPEHKADMLV